MILNSRRMGVSTLFFEIFFRSNITTMIIAHRRDFLNALACTTKFTYESNPDEFELVNGTVR